MPAFILDTGSIEAARQLKTCDAFTQAYIEAMFWTDCNSDSEDLADATLAELAPEAWESIIADCKTWQEVNAPGLVEAYASEAVTYDESAAGHDYWLTRNHHGAGFWDRDLDDTGKQLTEAAHAAGEVSLYRGDDELIYLM